MTLTVGAGPFGHHPAGRFNREIAREGLLLLDDSPRWIRGVAAGETIIDSREAKLLYEHGRLPVFYFPRDDVRMDLLEEEERRDGSAARGPELRFALRVGDRDIAAAAWTHPEPPADAGFLDGLIAFEWDAMDEWLEEDEPMIVHARDPYHRIDILDTSRRVRILLEGEVLADTTRARALFETSLPPRWYIPREDVTAELIASETRTGCAYKGYASYWSVKAGDSLEDDLVWTYRDPRPEAELIRDRLAFFNERVDVEIDGELQEQPVTQWSRRR
jgi:uncharacterized protein (DUF427 family)